MMKEINSDEPLSQQLKSPSPPRWRFVSVAKKSSGYSSSAAGYVIDGLSAEELAVKYIPPPEAEVSHPKTRDRNVSKLGAKELENYCGGLCTNDNVTSRSSNDEPNADPQFSPDNDSEVVKIENISSSSEEALKLQLTDTTEELDDVFVDVPLDEPDCKDYNKGADPNVNALNGNTRYERRNSFLFILTILLITGVLGISLGMNKPMQMKKSETADAISGDSAFLNNTSNPSEMRSAIPSISPSENQSEVTEGIHTNPQSRPKSSNISFRNNSSFLHP